MKRVLTVTASAAAALVLAASPALACGGLIGPNGAVNLTRTTTFAGYADGIEHYITAFNFAGGTGKFGSITPLPDIPTKIERGGDWTLQRLVLETTPVRDFAAAPAAGASSSAAASSAEVLMTATVDALDITILRGNGDEVGRWAKKHGFRLPPDSPEVLDFYAKRSPIFMAAAFDADRAAARGQQVGDGTPLHLTIPTDDPWVPLRILGLGKQAIERVDADVYLLTERRPTMLPAPTPVGADFDDRVGLSLQYDQEASPQLLRDLHDDKSGSWVPLEGMWLSKVLVAHSAGALKYDLAIDQSGAGEPSIKAAGYTLNGLKVPALASSTPSEKAPDASADPGDETPDPTAARDAAPQVVAAQRKSPAEGDPRIFVVAVVLIAGIVGVVVALGRTGRRTP